MASTSDQSVYYVPHNGWYPVFIAFGVFCLLAGFGFWLNDIKAGESGNTWMMYLGGVVLAVVLFLWFAKVVEENQQGLANDQLKRSYVWGMGWFIFSEVMFFAAFFGALFYVRNFVVPWLGGEGGKGITGEFLWPEFTAEWPVVDQSTPARLFTI